MAELSTVTTGIYFKTANIHMFVGILCNCLVLMWLFLSSRISLVSGYLSEEVAGISAFKYMHKDDVRWTMVALGQSKTIKFSLK